MRAYTVHRLTFALLLGASHITFHWEILAVIGEIEFKVFTYTKTMNLNFSEHPSINLSLQINLKLFHFYFHLNRYFSNRF